MNPFRWSYRVSFLAGFLICVGLLGFALYAEYQLGMNPCPLCIFQRVGFLAMAVFFLLGALHAPRGVFEAGQWLLPFDEAGSLLPTVTTPIFLP